MSSCRRMLRKGKSEFLVCFDVLKLMFYFKIFRWVLKCKIKSASGWDCPWSIEDDSRLLAGVYEYGFGSWEAVKMDPSYKLQKV